MLVRTHARTPRERICKTCSISANKRIHSLSQLLDRLQHHLARAGQPRFAEEEYSNLGYVPYNWDKLVQCHPAVKEMSLDDYNFAKSKHDELVVLAATNHNLTDEMMKKMGFVFADTSKDRVNGPVWNQRGMNLTKPSNLAFYKQRAEDRKAEAEANAKRISENKTASAKKKDAKQVEKDRLALIAKQKKKRDDELEATVQKLREMPTPTDLDEDDTDCVVCYLNYATCQLSDLATMNADDDDDQMLAHGGNDVAERAVAMRGINDEVDAGEDEIATPFEWMECPHCKGWICGAPSCKAAYDSHKKACYNKKRRDKPNAPPPSSKKPKTAVGPSSKKKPPARVPASCKKAAASKEKAPASKKKGAAIKEKSPASKKKAVASKKPPTSKKKPKVSKK
jgi:hypothetical protein